MINEFLKIDGKYRNLLIRYEDNIRASEYVRIAINKETDIKKMLELALLHISLQIDDLTFYHQNIKKIL